MSHTIVCDMSTQRPTVEQLDVRAFAGTARSLARTMKIPALEGWLPLYERGLIAAHAQGDRPGLADIALFAAVRLDTDGLHAEAVAQLDFALALAGSDPSAI